MWLISLRPERNAMAFGGYTKLSSSILASTVWREKNETRIVWITMLAMANAQGVVEASVPGLADLARVTIPACEEALQAFQTPDPYSRTKEHDGRRIEPVDGGWLLLNHERHRERVNTDERREYLRLKKQESRQRARAGQQLVNTVNTGQSPSAGSTQAEAEAEAEAFCSSSKSASTSVPAETSDPAEQLREAWNELATAPIAKVRELGDARRRAAVARLRDHGLDGMRGVFQRINASPFCRGERGWRATFDWALKPANITKVLEGNYDDAGPAGPRRAPGRTGPPPAGKYDGIGDAADLDRAS